MIANAGHVARSSEDCIIRQAPAEENPNLHKFDFVQRPEMMSVSRIPPARETQIDLYPCIVFICFEIREFI